MQELDPKLVAAARIARTKANEMCKDLDAEGLRRELKSKRSTLRAMDCTFSFELDWLVQQLDVGGAARLRADTLRAMPDSKAPAARKGRGGLSFSIGALDSLCASALFRLSSKSVQAQVRSVRELCLALREGRKPTLGADPGDFMQQILNRALHFCTWADDTSGSQCVSGEEALQGLYKQCRAHEAANSLTIGSLEPLLVFGWALQESERKCVDDWLAKAVAKEASAGKAVGPSASSSSKGGAGASTAEGCKKARKEASLIEDVDALFE
jgi:hypothetical protein